MKIERLIGGGLGLVAFAAILAVGALKGVPFGDTMPRALCGLAIGVLVGWGLFGPLGMSIAREAGRDKDKDRNEKETGGEPSSPPDENSSS